MPVVFCYSRKPQSFGKAGEPILFRSFLYLISELTWMHMNSAFYLSHIEIENTEVLVSLESELQLKLFIRELNKGFAASF